MDNTRHESFLDDETLRQLAASADKANQMQIHLLRKVVDEILWKSISNKASSNGFKQGGSMLGIALSALIRKCQDRYVPGSFADDYNRIVLPQSCELDALESRLDDARVKIQSMSYKELFEVLRIFRNYGLEYMIDFVLANRIPVEVM